MPLTPEQVSKLRSDAGLTPQVPTASSNIIQSRLSEFDKAVAPPPKERNIVQSTVGTLLDPVAKLGAEAGNLAGNRASTRSSRTCYW